MKLKKLVICALAFIILPPALVAGCSKSQGINSLLSKPDRETPDSEKIDNLAKILKDNPDCCETAIKLLANTSIDFAQKCFEEIPILNKFLKEKCCIIDITNLSWFYMYDEIKSKKYIELLLQFGADINCTNKKTWSLGSFTSSTGGSSTLKNASIVHFCLVGLQQGLSKAKDEEDKEIVYNRFTNVIRFLGEHGADFNIKAESIKLEDGTEYKNISAYELAKKLKLDKAVIIMEDFSREKSSIEHFAQALHSLSK